jgi:hypothetical protein
MVLALRSASTIPITSTTTVLALLQILHLSAMINIKAVSQIDFTTPATLPMMTSTLPMRRTPVTALQNASTILIILRTIQLNPLPKIRCHLDTINIKPPTPKRRRILLAMVSSLAMSISPCWVNILTIQQRRSLPTGILLPSTTRLRPMDLCLTVAMAIMASQPGPL